MSAADSRNVAALSSNTVGTSATTSRNAAIAGPTKKARLSRVLPTPLAAVSSRGSSTSDGMIAWEAGRRARPDSDDTVATTNTASTGTSAQISTAATVTSTARTRSETTMTGAGSGRRGRQRTA